MVREIVCKRVEIVGFESILIINGVKRVVADLRCAMMYPNFRKVPIIIIDETLPACMNVWLCCCINFSLKSIIRFFYNTRSTEHTPMKINCGVCAIMFEELFNVVIFNKIYKLISIDNPQPMGFVLHLIVAVGVALALRILVRPIGKGDNSFLYIGRKYLFVVV